MSRKKFTLGGETIHIDIDSHNAKGKGRTMAGRKRKVSKKVLAILRRGRAKLAGLRKKRPVGKTRVRLTRLKRADREQVRRTIKEKSLYGASRGVRSARPLSTEGAIVARKSRTRRTAKRRRVHGFEGFEGRGKRRHHRMHGGARRRRRSGRLMGGLNVSGIKRQVMPIALGIAGAAAAAFALEKLPKTMNPMLKAGIPLGAGILSAVMLKNPMIASVGLGAAIIGGYALARQALPTMVPALSGVEDTVSASGMPMGMLEDLSGDVAQLGNATDISGELDGMDGELDGELEGMDGELDGELEGMDAL